MTKGTVPIVTKTRENVTTGTVPFVTPIPNLQGGPTMATLANYTDQFTQEEFYHKSRENGWVVKGDRNFLYALYLAASKNKEMYALAQIIGSKNIWHVDDRKEFIPFVVKTVHDAIF